MGEKDNENEEGVGGVVAEKVRKKRKDLLIKKGVPVQRGDGQDGVLWDVTFHKTLGSTSTS